MLSWRSVGLPLRLMLRRSIYRVQPASLDAVLMIQEQDQQIVRNNSRPSWCGKGRRK
jgi:hypothetical protein